MKRYALSIPGIFLLSFSSSLMAEEPEYYVGTQLGYHDNSFDFNFSGPSQNADASSSSDGLSGGFFAGVKLNVNEQVFVAPEVNISETNASGSFLSDFDIEAKLSYGIGVLFGISISDETSIYSRLGYQRMDYELIEKSLQISEQETFDGFRYGAGVETDISSSVAMRLEWSQTSYTSSEYSDNSGTASLEPTENLFQIGLSYRF